MIQLKEMAMAQKTKVYLLVSFAMLSGIVIIGQAYYFVSIVDRIFIKGQSFQAILPLLYGLIAVLLARAALHYARGTVGVKMSSKVKSDLRKALLDRFSRNPVQASIQGQSGQKVSVILDAVDGIDDYFRTYIPQVIQTSIIPIIILIVAFTQNLYTGLIIIVTAPFIPIFMIIIGKKTKDKSEEQMDKLAAFSAKFLDTLQGLLTLKLFGKADKEKDTIKKSSLGFRDATMEVLKIAFTNSLMLELISMLSMGLIALEVAIRLIVFQDIAFFTAFFMLVLAPEFYTALKELGNAFHTGRGSMGAARKIEAELTDLTPPVNWGEASLLDEDTPPEIQLAGTGFAYGEDTFALKNIHAKVRPYEQIAIVGRSGAGKSTLLHMIAGLLPLLEGKILINGKPLLEYKEKDWFDQLSYISQDPYLFSGTIADNIAIGSKENATQNDVEQAAEKAGISRLVASLKDGYDTVIGEAGRGLSGGEKQRVAIARAFLKKPTVILFDEPTTGLDLETEHILQASMKELAQSSTIITVAHRLHTIKNADKILFMENGQLVASGTHEKLMDSIETYRSMVTVQQGGRAE
ncbi:thiol reductant ABC exporter subunit CydD [Virgibacillus byunsanensis]|uniref:Thiol reductant ABC exporter subunit CydD n=1 Tax=Virgibacillus byunsanensis TaxID=570945 RepID=A0ABW3LQ24_9BACI